ncbi:MAG: DUF433 domain-containing protein [Oscillatoriales cyanobacterium]|nr:MAG: DUF433 domain-containing protein [Oscillatoriales cyanobacterium]TAH16391.1 MAG: DUF433 domain-containing protein [Oscillatoriales cyanobacterium]
MSKTVEVSLVNQPKQLKDYFDFWAADDIRIKETRIGIEDILDEYIYGKKSPEVIADLFPTVTLEQIYATIFYYLQNPVIVGKYVENWLEYTLQAQAEHDENPPPVVLRLRKLKAEREANRAAQ